jgi:hypothetical protein
LGIGDWGLGPIPNPQSPIPNPQSGKFLQVLNMIRKFKFKIKKVINIKEQYKIDFIYLILQINLNLVSYLH